MIQSLGPIAPKFNPRLRAHGPRAFYGLPSLENLTSPYPLAAFYEAPIRKPRAQSLRKRGQVSRMAALTVKASLLMILKLAGSGLAFDKFHFDHCPRPVSLLRDNHVHLARPIFRIVELGAVK